MKKKQNHKEKQITHILQNISVVFLTSLTLFYATSSSSYAAIYKCNLPDGSIAYSNDKKLSKNCTVTNLNASSNFSVIDTPSVSTLNKEANYYASTNPNNNNTNKNFPKLSDGANSSNSNIESSNAAVNLNVSEATQTRRDETRNGLLQKELDAEQKTLDDNKAELASLVQSLGKSLGNNKNDSLNEQASDKIAKLQQSIEMHKNNIMALNKELKKPDIVVKDTKTDTQRASDENSKLASNSPQDTSKDNQDLSKISMLEKQINDNKLDPKQVKDAIAIKNSVNNSSLTVANSSTTTTNNAANNSNVVNKIKEISKDITPVNMNNSSTTTSNTNTANNKESNKNPINFLPH